MTVTRLRLAPAAYVGLLCGIIACAGVPKVRVDHLSPVRDRATDETITSDLQVLDAWQARADALARSGSPNAAAIAAARGWVQLARDAYERNDRSTVPDTALANAVRLIEAIERGGNPSVVAGMSNMGPMPDRVRTLSSELAAFAAADGQATSLPEFGATQVLLARASHAFLRGPACVDGDPAEGAAASLARLRAESDRRRTLTEQARQAPIPPPTPTERVPVTPAEPPHGMPARCHEIELPATVHFALDRYDLSAATRGVLDGLASKLAENSDVVVTLDGNTDPRASDEYNDKLSEHRASAVRAYLISKGVDGSRLDLVASGEHTPTVPGSTARDHARNRRVEMRYRSSSGCAIRVIDQSADLQLERQRPPVPEKED